MYLLLLLLCALLVSFNRNNEERFRSISRLESNKNSFATALKFYFATCRYWLWMRSRGGGTQGRGKQVPASQRTKVNLNLQMQELENTSNIRKDVRLDDVSGCVARRFDGVKPLGPAVPPPPRQGLHSPDRKPPNRSRRPPNRPRLPTASNTFRLMFEPSTLR